MTKQVLVIKADGGVSTEQVENSKEYDFLSKAVAGWIEAVDLDQELAGLTLWINEEGKLTGLPFNFLATKLWEMSYGKTDIIVGDAVITGGTDDNGETKSLTENQITRIKSVIGVS